MFNLIRFFIRFNSFIAAGTVGWCMISGECSFEKGIVPLLVSAGLFILCKKRKKTQGCSKPKTPKVGLFDLWCLGKLAEMSGGTPTNSYVDTTQTNAYGYTANYQDNARAEREERRKRELADYAGKADYWEREYRRLIRLDPQCRDERTRVAEYNKNSFRLKSQGRW